jgi:phosphomannomutase
VHISLVAFDLDDTLAPSKTPVEPEMAALLKQLLDHVEVCIISGGQIKQFTTQVTDRLDLNKSEQLRLHLMPTCGTQYFRVENDRWAQVYAENLTPDEAGAALEAAESVAKKLGLWEEQTWGPILENRGTQITYSALGQEAPVDAKSAWDPDGSKKAVMREKIADLLPNLEVRSGGSTSIDITRKGIDKAYGMRKLAELTGVPLDKMLFVGDRLDPEGNDYPVKVLGVRCHAVTGWPDTAQFIRSLIEEFDK